MLKDLRSYYTNKQTGDVRVIQPLNFPHYICVSYNSSYEATITAGCTRDALDMTGFVEINVDAEERNRIDVVFDAAVRVHLMTLRINDISL